MADLDLNISGDVRTMRLEPGDIVVVKTSRKLSLDMLVLTEKRLRGLLEEAGYSNKIVVLDHDVDVSILKKGDLPS